MDIIAEVHLDQNQAELLIGLIDERVREIGDLVGAYPNTTEYIEDMTQQLIIKNEIVVSVRDAVKNK